MTTTDRAAGPLLAPGGRVAIIAGGGRLPLDLVEALQGQGANPYLVLIRGEADAGSPLAGHDHAWIEIEEFPRVIGLLKKAKAARVVLAGTISRRPKLSALRPKLALLPMLPRALWGLARGDDALLRSVAGVIEQAGFTVIGAHQVLPDLLAPDGTLGKIAPQTGDRRDIEAALEAARAIGALDIGQAAVAVGGRAIALEGIEGTDGLLLRVKDLRPHGRLAGKSRGVLAKICKANQDPRADLPSIGPDTIRSAHAAGLAGVVVEAGRSLVLDAAGVVEAADRLGLFVMGVKAGQP